MRIESIPAAATYSLRNEMLRPGLPVETVHFAGDHDRGTTHFGAYSQDEHLVGIVTLLESPLPPELVRGAPRHLRVWQLRGMATSPLVRGQGFGQALLRACLDHVRDSAGQGLIWCNARTSALSFYAAYGFVPLGAQFEIAHGGPHFKMLARVQPTLALELVPGSFAVVRLPPEAAPPDWLPSQGFVSVTRTNQELSIVCAESAIPTQQKPDPPEMNLQGGWTAVRVRGQLDFALTGILASLSTPLAHAGIPLFAVSTFNTDYIFVPHAQWNEVREAWVSAGHSIERSL